LDKLLVFAEAGIVCALATAEINTGYALESTFCGCHVLLVRNNVAHRGGKRTRNGLSRRKGDNAGKGGESECEAHFLRERD
jgi:hypothetical protein